MITESWLTMVLFALLMVISCVFMIRTKATNTDHVTNDKKISTCKLVLFCGVIGMVTGLLGARKKLH